MKFNKFLSLSIAFILSFLAACGGGETPDKPANANTVNAPVVNAANTITNDPLATTTATPAQTVNNAETVKPVVLAYYQALKTKDEAALKKIYSRETLMTLEKDAAEEKKSLVEFITEIEPAPAKPFEVRNETVQGDTAIAQIFSPQYPNGVKLKFVKENGEWKMTNESPEFQKN